MIQISPRKAIANFCKHCIYDPGNGGGTWRQQVEACTSYDCPLFEFRPKSYTAGGDPVGEEEDNLDLPLEVQDSPQGARFALLQELTEDTE
jgi:hypothetical protein